MHSMIGACKCDKNPFLMLNHKKANLNLTEIVIAKAFSYTYLLTNMIFRLILFTALQKSILQVLLDLKTHSTR